MSEERNENKMKGRNILYAVVGIMTLVVSIVGATYAYYTATNSNSTTITGNMATVSLSLSVTKAVNVDETNGGMIPMSNGMIEKAVTNSSTKGVCVDDNGNAVCKIYKITLTNNSSSGQFVDGYVTLSGGSGEPTDYPNGYTAGTKTTMRWAQVFVSGSTYSTGGTQYLYNETASGVALKANRDASLTTLGNTANGADSGNIATAYSSVTGDTTISGNSYKTITKNYIRISDYDSSSTKYDREDDITSALVYSHSLTAGTEVNYYIVVWLSETGTNQTVGATGAAESATSFFTGTVTFISAQGSEISATFADYTRVPASDY